MWRPDGDALGRELTAQFGLPTTAAIVPGAGPYPVVSISPSGLPAAESFSVSMLLGWRSISATLVPGAFAGQLLAEMGRAGEAERAAFAGLADKFVRARARVSLVVNGIDMDPARPAEWPAEWTRLELSLEKSPATVNTEDHEANDREIATWARRFMSLSLALMPLEEVTPAEPDNPEGLPEGAKTRVEVNRYERSRINRTACLEIHGDSCKACTFSFGREYGSPGQGLIFVHHIVPVSQLAPGYQVNPATDLVPLCANCHAIAHRRAPPYSVDEIRGMLRRRLE